MLIYFPGGAVGRIHSPNAYAEIEGEESELVSIDTPLAPQRDLIALLKQTTAVPQDHANISLKSFFISVDEERTSQHLPGISEHVRDLLQEYQGKDESNVFFSFFLYLKFFINNFFQFFFVQSSNKSK